MFEFHELNLDTDGDGIMDAYGEYVDTDGDGVGDMLSALWKDLDGDGYLETQFVDTDGDGIMETMWMDGDGDGVMETMGADTDKNGVFDTFYQELDTDGDGVTDVIAKSWDYNQDGRIDVLDQFQDSNSDGQMDVHTKMVDSDSDGVYDKFSVDVDTNGDMEADQHEEMQMLDQNQDGVVDTAVVEIDSDMDGQANRVEQYDYDAATGEFTLVDVIDMDIAGPVDLENFDPSQADPEDICGDPAADMENWECQGQTNRCALFSQKFIIEELTDQDVDIEEMADIAEANGWFSEEGGTPVLHMDKMLEYYGLEVEKTWGNDYEDLRQALENGEKVIVGLDSGEIWYGETDNVFAPVDGADHAVQVIGIDESDPDCPMVILNDSGNPNGCGEMVPLDVFMDAWEDGNCYMVTCQ